MVTRKPVNPTPIDTSIPPPQSSASAVPYPTTPPVESAKTIVTSSSFYSQDQAASTSDNHHEVTNFRTPRPRSDSDASHGTWDSSDGEGEDPAPARDDSIIPAPLRITPSKQNLGSSAQPKVEEKKNELPASLRPGPIGGPRPALLTPNATGAARKNESLRYGEEMNANPWTNQHTQEEFHTQTTVAAPSNNPYRQDTQDLRNNQNPWQDNHPAVPTQPPPPPPMNTQTPSPGYPTTPTSSAPSRSTVPVPSDLPPIPPPPPAELPTDHTPLDELSKMSLNSEPPSRHENPESLPVLVPPAIRPQPASKPYSEQGDEFPPSNPWRNPSPARPPGTTPNAPSSSYQVPQSDIVYPPPPGPPPSQSNKLIDHPEPPRPPNAIATSQPMPSPSLNPPETPQTKAKRQRNEFYHIKHVNWYDASYSTDPRFKDPIRRSPILTQNENGPCPLLALVNALVLSTPQNVDTALVETLRTREQVSLGLLLDAVFDELMSGRRGDSDHLPDVSDLYAFLLALHTGMNVNPRFINHVNAQNQLGGFEDTREMRLYSTFNIPLIHGWTPSKDSPAYSAFERSAQTFEDAQNIQFAEAELEDQLRSHGLSGQEQRALQDIQTIKAFLNHWPTQLTDYGLQNMSRNLKSGQIAILFRNDHFSTIYKEPKSGALMTLVTDTGYSSHEEIVWESLVDVNGAACEMFSGDFRVVSHSQDARLDGGNSAGGGDGWHGDHPRFHSEPSRNDDGPLYATNPDLIDGTDFESPPPLPGPRPISRIDDDSGSALGIASAAQLSAAEQEDHDLALALQLQEEEEAQEREAGERRRREQELSEQFLSNEPEARPPIPPRRSGGPGHPQSTVSRIVQGRNRDSFSGRNGRGGAPAGRPPVSRPSDGAANVEAPPSYEEAATDRLYRPGDSIPPATQGHPLDTYDALRLQQQAGAYASPVVVNTHGRRRSDGRTGRRRDSNLNPGQMPGGYPGASSSHLAGPSNGRVNQAAGLKDAEEKCVIM
ncbi:Hypothetical protein R9X50_00186600 [Acrodontium crateriforme]|uniref:MINDY deubiquitinase domain-containing protein n=1 Tax=Acrodontium crateriforme TaxID=150365 RepID=A0AAQ3M1A1_9PEZI|nr:Hypothetical protein R9X50_00186600 [Acrodontium crateriforme]